MEKLALDTEKQTHKINLLIVVSLFVLLVVTVLTLAFSGNITVKVLMTMVAVTAVFVGLIILLGDRYIKFTLIAPSIFIMLVVTFVPMIFLLVMSVTDVKLFNFNKKWNFVGLSNYLYFLTKDKLFWPTMLRTLEYTLFALISQVILGMGLAVLFQKRFRGRNMVSSFLVIPVMTCPIVIAMLWKSMMNSETGVLNVIIRRLGGAGVNWLTNEPIAFIQKIPFIGQFFVNNLNANVGFVSMVLVNTWQWTPFVFLMVLAGINSLPKEPFEAAYVDGATVWQQFRNITLPLLKPVINVIILMRLIDLMKVYDQIYALFGDNITARTLNIHIFAIGLTNQNYGKGSALSVLVLVFIMALTKVLTGINNNIDIKKVRR
jgi:multiple sugar transport system permease protein